MTDPELHPYVEWIAREAKRSVVIDPRARSRLLDAIRAEPVPTPGRGSITRWIGEPRFSLSAAAITALAAGLVGIGVFLGRLSEPSTDRDDQQIGQPSVAAASAARLPVTDTVVKFVFVAPHAGRVALVGDFNDWNPSATPMTRSEQGGLWTITMPLEAGRHLYAFIVDDRWTADPAAPQADDGFGQASSVVLVGRGPSTS